MPLYQRTEPTQEASSMVKGPDANVEFGCNNMGSAGESLNRIIKEKYQISANK